jgi:hypothetical protein
MARTAGRVLNGRCADWQGGAGASEGIAQPACNREKYRIPYV